MFMGMPVMFYGLGKAEFSNSHSSVVIGTVWV